MRVLILNRSLENTFLPKKLAFSAKKIVLIVFSFFTHFFSDWLMFKIVERDWLIKLRGAVYRFDETNDYKRMKQNNDGKCSFFITQ